MSMIIGRKQVILAALVIALGAAIYLNYRFSDNIASVFNSKATLGTASYVDNQKVSGTASSTANIFSQARLSREQKRDQAVDLLKNATASATAADKQSAETAIEAIAQNVVTEGNIETMIKTKGFSDCVAILDNGNVTIVVKPKTGNTLSDSDTAQIHDVVIKETNISVGKIQIQIAK
jgi:stage III sporulation protein AH